MKKVMIATSLVALIGLGMGSCKKEFECKCVEGLSTDTTTVTGKGKTAVEACDDEDKILTLKDCWPA